MPAPTLRRQRVWLPAASLTKGDDHDNDCDHRRRPRTRRGAAPPSGATHDPTCLGVEEMW